MRVAVAVVVLALLLAGCSGDSKGKKGDGSSDFGDVDVAPTETTGIILGVVVDEAIRPLAGAEVAVTGNGGQALQEVTDNQGRFAFGDLEPGIYLISARLLNYGSTQATAEVVAGEDEPPIARLQLVRLFSQEPFHEQIPYDGFLACAYAVGVSSTCVNDYTRVTGQQCVPQSSPPQCYCSGGCFRDQNLAKQGGNIREYVSQVGPGWQRIIWEETWKPTSDAGKNMGFTVSYFDRPTAGHWFASVNGANPLRLEVAVGEKHASAVTQAGTPEMIPAEGYDQIFTFFGAGSGSVVINQAFKSFETHFFYGIPPDGWSFVAGDEFPF